MHRDRLKKPLIISITAVLLYGCYSLYTQICAKASARYAQIVVESPFENVQTDTDIINTYFQEKVSVVKRKMYRDGVLLWETDYDRAGEEIKKVRYKSDGSIDEWMEYECSADGKTSEKIWYHGNGNVSLRTVCKYDETGHLIESVEYNHSGDIIDKSTYAYDEAGNEIECVEYFGDELYRRTEYEYDTAGKLVGYTVYNGNGDMCGYQTHTYEYDEEGNVMKDVTFGYDTANADSSMGSWHYSYEYQYDKAGNMVKRISYITDDEYFMSEWEYDEKGRLLTEIEYYDDGVSIRTKDEYEYDSDGKRIKRIRTEYGKTEKEITDFYYDEWGNLIEERTGAESNTYEYEYEYE